ncbi:complement C1q and tumor necrosis factor-related protein 9-like [Clupea harengus]|uniref:Complement C1q and tumor necrosis factor-related protein 9-like n=1 Tax=Clupea harengus TaxID=7950 RepID=A0A8M1KTX4_CLUHA|nr:complement C1q and tumor necrosis factor-related protein 9-like [Clupea harengus]
MDAKDRLTTSEKEIESLKKNAEQPKVAFSVALTDSGFMGPVSVDTNLVYTKVITNVGQAYNHITGFFTAPARGVYYFRFTTRDSPNSHYMGILLCKNGEKVMFVQEYDCGAPSSVPTRLKHEPQMAPTMTMMAYLSSGASLQLEVGDVVNMRLPAGYRVYDDLDNHTTFTGFLLFTL